MSNFISVNKETKIINSVFGWGDDRELPKNYPIQDDELILKIPENIANILQNHWQTNIIKIVDTNVIFDSTADYNKYFLEISKQ